MEDQVTPEGRYEKKSDAHEAHVALAFFLFIIFLFIIIPEEIYSEMQDKE